MKFKILVNYTDPPVPNSDWWESYDREEVETLEQAEKWGRDTVDEFNATLRPQERARVFIRAEIVGKSDIEHSWDKTNSFTVMNRGLMYDTYRCSVCGITGRRYGLGAYITRDRKYKAKKYAFCKENFGMVCKHCGRNYTGNICPGCGFGATYEGG